LQIQNTKYARWVLHTHEHSGERKYTTQTDASSLSSRLARSAGERKVCQREIELNCSFLLYFIYFFIVLFCCFVRVCECQMSSEITTLLRGDDV